MAELDSSEDKKAFDLTFLGYVEIGGKITLVTGLHIGAGRDTIEIGGENAVIRHPITRDPYIPGSSLKGKLRHICECQFGKVRRDGNPWGFDGKPFGERNDQPLKPDDPIARIFGVAAQSESIWRGGPTRLIVRDSFLRKEWRKEQVQRMQLPTHLKAEVAINRCTGKAGGGGPRNMEQVVPTAEFVLDMVFRLYRTQDGDNADIDCLNWLIAAFRLLEKDTLGGSGSRGYGKVKVKKLKVTLPGGKVIPVAELPEFDRDSPPTLIKLEDVSAPAGGKGADRQGVEAGGESAPDAGINQDEPPAPTAP